MNDDIDLILEKCSNAGSTYSDVRIENSHVTTIMVNINEIESISIGINSGIGLRVLKDGVWGFAYGSLDDFEKVIDMALSSVSLITRFKKEDVKLKEVPVIEDRVEVSFQKNPQDRSSEEKTRITISAAKAMKGDPKIKTGTVTYKEVIKETLFGNSEGTRIEVKIPRIMLYCTCTVKDAEGGTLQGASRLGHVGGLEIFDKESPEESALRAMTDAIEGVKAPKIKPGRYNVVMDGAMNGLFAHEAVGHSAEGDFCRTAGVLRGKLGKKVAAPNVTLIDDAQLEIDGYRTFGYIPYDDEGVETTRIEIIKDGVLKHYLTDRATAQYWNLDTTGNARAEAYSNEQIVRMRNTWIEATHDPMTPEELVSEIKNGLLLKKSTGGEVDPIRGTFNFGTGEIRLIENEEVTDRRRPTTCAGNTIQTLKNIIGVNNMFDNPHHSIGFCGKDGQSVPTSIGGGWMAVKNITIGG
jgi:TldD protein